MYFTHNRSTLSITNASNNACVQVLVLNFLNVNISCPNKIPKGANIPSHFQCDKSTTVVNASKNACVQDLVSIFFMLALKFHIQLKKS